MTGAARAPAALKNLSPLAGATFRSHQAGQRLKLAAAGVIFRGKFAQGGRNDGKTFLRQPTEDRADFALLKRTECWRFCKSRGESVANFGVGRGADDVDG